MASHSSPMESTTRLFAIPRYSKLGQKPPGSVTLVKELYFRRHVRHVKVSPCDVDKGVPNSIDVIVSTEHLRHSCSGTTISIEILDDTWKRTVFHTEQVLGSDIWFKYLTVTRSELEAKSCVHNDIIPVRCTLTFLDVEKQKRQQRAAARAEWWRQFNRSLVPKSFNLRSTS